MSDKQAHVDGGPCGTGTPAMEIRPLQSDQDAIAFQRLNEEWITTYFVLETKDREILGDPKNNILRKGGHIFLVFVEGEAVGCVALVPFTRGVYEVSKMAVSPRLRGLGIGRKLLEHAIAEAKRMGARTLFLGTNKKLRNAVHLYEAAGFRHVTADEIPPMPYARADVLMRLELLPA